VTENTKPEWFEIAENDGPAMLSKTMPILRLRRLPTAGQMRTIMKVKIT